MDNKELITSLQKRITRVRKSHGMNSPEALTAISLAVSAIIALQGHNSISIKEEENEST